MPLPYLLVCWPVTCRRRIFWYGAARSATQSSSPPAVHPGRKTTNALGTSPASGSGLATTAQSATQGLRIKNDGQSATTAFVHIWRWRGDQISHFQLVTDTLQLAQLLGPSHDR